MKVPAVEYRFPERDETWRPSFHVEREVRAVIESAPVDATAMAFTLTLFSGAPTPVPLVSSEPYGPLELRMAR